LARPSTAPATLQQNDEPKLSPAEEKVIRDAFHKVDIDNNGTLDHSELRQFFLELNRMDLDADRDVDEIRKLGSNRKNQRILDTDRCDLRACLVFFAHRPKPVVAHDKADSQHLFEKLGGSELSEGAALPVQAVDDLLREEFGLDISLSSFVEGSDSVTLADLDGLLVVPRTPMTATALGR